MSTEETTGTAGNTENNVPVPATEPKNILPKTALKSKKAAGNKSVTKKPTEKPSGQLGFDPKNREVSLTKHGEKFTVTKAATGFTFTGTEKKAKEVYKHQINCSHN